jgi:predicted HD superfamily hydrolase involved in NAD metabolism
LHPLFSALVEGIEFSGSIRQDVAVFLNHHEYPNTAAHCFDVADQAVALAQRFGADPGEAALAGWLHDISAVIPNNQRLGAAEALGLEILPEEAQVPLLLHQKLSAEIAREIFNLRREDLLAAICCHTTLREQPTTLDNVLFVADKLAWDQKGPPPYLEELQAALEESLELAAYCYQDYLLRSGKIITAHPWMLASHRELSAVYG